MLKIHGIGHDMKKVKALSFKEKLLSTTWNSEDNITLMVGSTIRKVFRLYVMA